MEPTNEVKAKVVEQKIADVEQEKYGLMIDHEVHTLVGNHERVAKIEATLANSVKVLKFLNKKLAELKAPTVEHVNGKEPAVMAKEGG